MVKKKVPPDKEGKKIIFGKKFKPYHGCFHSFNGLLMILYGKFSCDERSLTPTILRLAFFALRDMCIDSADDFRIVKCMEDMDGILSFGDNVVGILGYCSQLAGIKYQLMIFSPLIWWQLLIWLLIMGRFYRYSYSLTLFHKIHPTCCTLTYGYNVIVVKKINRYP